MLTRDQIMAAPAAPLGSVDVPEWGGAVALRSLSVEEALAWHAEADTTRRVVLIVRMACCDADGRPLFAADDDAWVASLPHALAQRVAMAALRHNGLAGDSAEAAAGN